MVFSIKLLLSIDWSSDIIRVSFVFIISLKPGAEHAKHNNNSGAAKLAAGGAHSCALTPQSSRRHGYRTGGGSVAVAAKPVADQYRPGSRLCSLEPAGGPGGLCRNSNRGTARTGYPFCAPQSGRQHARFCRRDDAGRQRIFPDSARYRIWNPVNRQRLAWCQHCAAGNGPGRGADAGPG